MAVQLSTELLGKNEMPSLPVATRAVQVLITDPVCRAASVEEDMPSLFLGEKNVLKTP